MIRRVWKGGTDTYVVTVPKDFRDLNNIQYGDYIDVDFFPIKKKIRETNRYTDEGREERE